MTQEDLKREIESLVTNAYSEHVVDTTRKLLELINKHMKDVVGEDEEELSYDKWSTHDPHQGDYGVYSSWIRARAARNALREDQLKRAGL